MSTISEALLHPIRLRIVLALGTEQLTTTEIAERLPDVPHATLYRHVAALTDAGLLEVVEERRVRGGVERRYAVVSEAALIGPGDVSTISPEELLGGFVVFAGSLIDSFARYLQDDRAKPAEDPMGYRQAGIWLDSDEAAELIQRLRDAISPFLENPPAPERRRVLLNTILIPDVAATPSGSDE